MNAREEILGRLRTALRAAPEEPEPVRDYRRTGTADPEELRALLVDRLRDYRATVHETEPDGLPATLAAVLADVAVLAVPAGLPPEWLAGHTGELREDPGVDGLDTSDAVLTGAAVAIAETGTIILDAGRAQGRRALTLVPDRHICVLFAEQVVAGVPEALARLDTPTAPLTWISGPSATSDIELRRVEGVHGPRRLDVVLVYAADG
ncbi:lactate utilization protein C [Phytomonospora sp. NPDC050363]|uniref:LutC/YkgG family protein n=1 Tax=Phytomonospora sp. NPDC050363 TaxID=3155642 RepID=UPI0034083231